MLETTIGYLKGPTGLEKIVFCLYGTESYDIFASRLGREISK